MIRSLRLALAALVGLALAAAGAVLPVVAASAATWDWTTIPGATATDLIPNNDWRMDSAYRNSPGYDLNARSTGLAEYCATMTRLQHVAPGGCSPSDYAGSFVIDSSAVVNGVATVVITPTDPTSPQLVVWGPQSNGSYQQLFTSTNHAYVFIAALVNGMPFGQTGTTANKTCYYNVPCTLLWDTSMKGADTFVKLITQKTSGSQLLGQYSYFVPVTPQTQTPIPPTAAFSANYTGSHTWALDASASTAATGNTVRSYQWTFGDGQIQTTTGPGTSHQYPDGSAHTASLVVTDTAGTPSASVSHQLTEPNLIVNSSGDAPATDPRAGCDTGATISTGARECTLRAAIQALDAGSGDTTIAFSLPAGSTTVTPASTLPNITRAGAKIQGSAGATMPVISGALHVTADGVTITQVTVLGGGDYSIYFQHVAGATLTGSFIGVTASGTVDAAKNGVLFSGSGAVTLGDAAATGNTIVGSEWGAAVTSFGAPVTSAKLIGNRIGLRNGDTLAFSSPIGVGAFFLSTDQPMSGVDVESNVIAGAYTNLALAGSGIAAPTIANNRLGVGADQNTLIGTPSQNLRLDGVPGAQVIGNQIAGALLDVIVSGSLQTGTSINDAGQTVVTFHTPGDGRPMQSPVTGTHDMIANNRIGTTTRHTIAAGNPDGITVWNAADDTTISSNTVLNHDDTGIKAYGAAARLVVSGNTVGLPPGHPGIPGYHGISIADQTSPTVTQNTVGGVTEGISLSSTTTGAVVSGNTVGLWTDGATADAVPFGIEVYGPNATIGPDNTVGNGTTSGVSVAGAGARVFSNRIGLARFGSGAAPNAIGIKVGSGAAGAVVGGSGVGNTISGNAVGVQLDAVGAEVSNNSFGTTTAGTLGNGIAVKANVAASVHDNTIRASTVAGVMVATGAVVKVQHNAIYGTTDAAGIATALAAPVVDAAVREQSGASARTWLVLHGVPTATGLIEVFGNADCADPEGRVPLFTTPTTSAATRVLNIQDRTEFAGLTVTVTTAAGTTGFSTCRTTDTSPADADGDGIPDAVESAYPNAPGLAASAGGVAFVGDNQQWIVANAVSFDKDYPDPQFSHVALIDDPDPSGHPGATFPLGLIDWTVTGIRPGAPATVLFSLPGTVINGWWKYNTHATPQYFSYLANPAGGYGAAVTAMDLPAVGLSTNVLVVVPDGGYGDDDGLANGTVLDPAAPAVVADAPAAPVAKVASTASTHPASVSSLAATGINVGYLPGAALALLVLGTLCVVGERASRRPVVGAVKRAP